MDNSEVVNNVFRLYNRHKSEWMMQKWDGLAHGVDEKTGQDRIPLAGMGLISRAVLAAVYFFKISCENGV